MSRNKMGNYLCYNAIICEFYLDFSVVTYFILSLFYSNLYCKKMDKFIVENPYYTVNYSYGLYISLILHLRQKAMLCKIFIFHNNLPHILNEIKDFIRKNENRKLL